MTPEQEKVKALQIAVLSLAGVGLTLVAAPSELQAEQAQAALESLEQMVNEVGPENLQNFIVRSLLRVHQQA